MDTFEEYDLDSEDYEKIYDEWQKRIHEPFDPSELNIDEETEIEIAESLKSELFHIEIREGQDEGYIEAVVDEVEELACRLINNPDTFISLVRRKPSLILVDGVIQYTIRKLQREINPEYSDGTTLGKTGRTAIKAMETLTNAGIGAFIPKNAPPKNIAKDKLYAWRANPLGFVSEVSLTRSDIVRHMKDVYKNSGDKTEAYLKVFKRMYGEKLYGHKKLIKKLIKTHEDKPTHVALIFLSARVGTSASSTISFWTREVPKELRQLAYKGKERVG
jgi:hypothetical protein